jgi:hypothetical protein
MFASIAQSTVPALRSTGRFLAPAVKEGAQAAISVVVVYGALIGAGIAGYSLYRGAGAVRRTTVNGARSAYGWAAAHTPSKKALKSRIDRMTAEATAHKAGATNGAAIELPSEA